MSNNKMYVDDVRPQKKRKTMRILLIVFCILVAALIGVGVYILVNVSQIWGDIDFSDNEDVIAEEDDVEGLPEVTYQEGNVSDISKSSDEIDIMLIGVDNRKSGKFTGRSDVMIYMRINTKEDSVKLVSFMRDTLVKIEDHGKNKLNTAYGYDGTDLMFKTYQENFGLKPDNYVVVNFYGMEDIIDGLDGVDIELESSELASLNKSINELNKIDGGKTKTIRKSGMQHLNGRQAVAYMRIRKPGGDSGRIVRQQTVLYALFEKASDVSAGNIPGLVGAMAEYVRTDIGLGRMVDIAKALHGMSASDLKTYRYPQDEKNGNYKGSCIVQPKDVDAELKDLKEFLNE